MRVARDRLLCPAREMDRWFDAALISGNALNEEGVHGTINHAGCSSTLTAIMLHRSALKANAVAHFLAITVVKSPLHSLTPVEALFTLSPVIHSYFQYAATQFVEIRFNFHGLGVGTSGGTSICSSASSAAVSVSPD